MAYIWPCQSIHKISIRTILGCHIVWLTLNESIYWLIGMLLDYGGNCQLYCGKIDWIQIEQSASAQAEQGPLGQIIHLFLFIFKHCILSEVWEQLYNKIVFWIHARLSWGKASGEILSSVLIETLKHHNVIWSHQGTDSHSTFSAHFCNLYSNTQHITDLLVNLGSSLKGVEFKN